MTWYLEDLIWWVFLDKRSVPRGYIDNMKDMYEEVITSVKTIHGETCEFPLTICWH